MNTDANPNFGGKTVNERLFVAGLLLDFDRLIHQKDRAKLIELLQKVELTPHQAKQTIDTIFENPSLYGF